LLFWSVIYLILDFEWNNFFEMEVVANWQKVLEIFF
jgi:hypothetical protein